MRVQIGRNTGFESEVCEVFGRKFVRFDFSATSDIMVLRKRLDLLLKAGAQRLFLFLCIQK